MNEILEKFGLNLVNNARDVTIAAVIKSMRGEMARADDVSIHDIYVSLDESERLRLERYVSNVIDTALHDFLSFIEGEPEYILAFKESDEALIDLNEVSDGLAGELVTEDGWIARFGDYESLL